MIKLVVSDIDGTLLEEATDRVNPDLYEIIRALAKKGIVFAAASGRQYRSMRHVMEPVASEIFFLAENGSLILKDEKVLYSDFIAPALAERVVRRLRTFPDGDVILSVPERLYLEKENPLLDKLLMNGYCNEVVVVPDLLPYCRRTNKITIHAEKDIDRLGAILGAEFKEELNVTVAGSVWVDFMNKTADKKTGLAYIQQLLGITPEETMAFGDNCNDIGLLQQAAESYAVANAHPQLKAVAKYEAPSYEEDGVLQVIRRQLLEPEEKRVVQ